MHLEGPLGSCRRVLEEIIADIDNGLRVEDDGFAELIIGSAVSLDDIRRNHTVAGIFRRLRRWNSASSEAWSKLRGSKWLQLAGPQKPLTYPPPRSNHTIRMTMRTTPSIPPIP